jgi:hypothetical protein
MIRKLILYLIAYLKEIEQLKKQIKPIKIFSERLSEIENKLNIIKKLL